MPIANNLAKDLQLIVPNLHRRYSGVTATNRMVAPKLAKMFRAAWLGSAAPDGIARMGFADLPGLWRRSAPVIWHARRNDEMIVGVLAARVRLAAETRVHLGGAAPSHLDHALADRSDGCRHRHQRYLRFLPQARLDRRDARRRHRNLCAAGRSCCGVCGERAARPLRHRLLRPRARAEGQRRVRRGDVPAAAALSRLHRRHGRRHRAGAASLRERIEEEDRSRQPHLTHRHDRRTCNRRRAALVQASDDLCLHLAQRRLWPDADRGDVGRRRARGFARRRCRTRRRGRCHRRADTGRAMSMRWLRHSSP